MKDTADKLAEETLIDFLDCEGFDIPEEAIPIICKAMQEYHEAKLKEELIKYEIWHKRIGWKNWSVKDWIKEYLKQRK